MARTNVSLKALEVFLAVARRGGLQAAARDLGISASTASHHLSELEKSVGATLFDHARRPLTLTAAGETLRARAEDAIGSLEKGLAEIWSEDASSLVRHVRLAIIEDLDADVTPALTHDLIRGAPGCGLSILSRPSHEILDLIKAKRIDIGVAATRDLDLPGTREMPLLHDPFILVLPRALEHAPQSLAELASADDLPLLRYSADQVLGQRIEAQLRRQGAEFPRRMTFEMTHVILSLVAAGQGWTITTALSFARAQRYHAELQVRPFLGRAFAREISVFVRGDTPSSITALATGSLRRGLQDLVIQPINDRHPWLAQHFTLSALTES
ncbi:MAG: LysR family transcriptional regulator [Pseudomonadota bacterium]